MSTAAGDLSCQHNSAITIVQFYFLLFFFSDRQHFLKLGLTNMWRYMYLKKHIFSALFPLPWVQSILIKMQINYEINLHFVFMVSWCHPDVSPAAAVVFVKKCISTAQLVWGWILFFFFPAHRWISWDLEVIRFQHFLEQGLATRWRFNE